MVAAAADPEPVDDEKIEIEDNYYIWEIRVGSNDEYWFLQLNVEGKIYKGRISPLGSEIRGVNRPFAGSQ